MDIDSKLEYQALKISDLYSGKMLNVGPMHIMTKVCGAGYLHSFHIRGLLAHNRHFNNPDYLEAARIWADWSIRMQGSYGDDAAFNMGYLFETKRGVPLSWFVADTLDQAYALLHVADELDEEDKLRDKILSAVLKYDDYIQQWFLGERGFALGYMDGEKLDKEMYHTATTRGICYYSAMYGIFKDEIYRKKGLQLVTAYMKDGYSDSNYHGSPLHNRCYASDAMVNAYYVLAQNDQQRQAILQTVDKVIVKWAVPSQMPQGYWVHDRDRGDPGSAKPLDETEVGPYSWGLLLGLQVFAPLLPDSVGLKGTIERGYDYLANIMQPGDVNRWGYHCWATVALAARLYPQYVFPWGKIIINVNNKKEKYATVY
jgi:hypothetical protein